MVITPALSVRTRTGDDNAVLARLLFICICIMLLPLAISSVRNRDNTRVSIEMIAVPYVLQVSAMSATLLARPLRFSRGPMAAFAIFVVIEVTSQLCMAAGGKHIHSLDMLNMAAKIINIIIFFVLLCGHRIEQRTFDKFMDYVIYLGLIACFANVVLYHEEVLSLSGISSSYEVNAKSFFANRNQFAQYIVLATIANTFRCVRGVTIFRLLAFTVFIGSLLITMSRTSCLGAVVFALTVSAFTTTNRYRFVISSAVGIAAILLVLYPGTRWFMVDILMRPDQGTSGRVDVWRTGWELAYDNNLFGGIGFFSAREMADRLGMEFCQFHSLYIDTLVTGGIVELAFVCGLIGYVIVRVRKSNMHREYKTIYCCGMLAVFVMSFFESISFFSVGYVDTLYTVFFVSIPVLASTNEPLVVLPAEVTATSSTDE